MNLCPNGCQALWMNEGKYYHLNVSMTEREIVPMYQFAEIQRSNQEDIHNLRSEPNSNGTE